jgi:hypothetical protein
MANNGERNSDRDMCFWLDLLVRPKIRDRTNAAKDKVVLIS